MRTLILRTCVVGLAALGLVGCFCGPSPAAEQERPNILFCIADDGSRHFGQAYGCDWVNDPNCRVRFPTAQEMQAIRAAIALVTCTDLRYWLEANVSNISVYGGYNGEWGDCHFGSGDVHLWDRTFAYAGELVKTLIHEASHALYTTETAAREAETRCGG